MGNLRSIPELLTSGRTVNQAGEQGSNANLSDPGPAPDEREKILCTRQLKPHVDSSKTASQQAKIRG